MGGVAIVGLGKGWDRNPAPVADYGALYHGVQGATNRFITINGGGEAVGPSAQLGRLFTPVIVAEYVKQGNVWIDYCGFPFFYMASSAGTIQTMGQNGWHQFADYLGYGWLRDVSFFVNISEGLNPFASQKPYQIARGFPLSQSLDGVCYCPTCTYTIPGGFLGIGGLNGVVTADGYTGMMALHPSGGGYYFYGAWTPELTMLRDNKAAQGIPTDAYVQFIQNVLHGNTSGYACSPYRIASQPTHPVSPGPTSPVKFHTPHTAQTAHTAHSTSPAAPNTRLIEEILGGTLIIGGTALSAVLIARHRRRG